MLTSRRFHPLLTGTVICLLAAPATRAATDLVGRSTPAVAQLSAKASSGSSLTIPYFEVDRTRASGKTLLFAVHNPFTASTEVSISYVNSQGVLTGNQTMTLDGREVATVNVRNVTEHLPPADPDGFSRGSISIEAADPFEPAIERLVTVDHFTVTPEENFATGGRAVAFHEMVAGPLSPFLCDLWSARFLNGGPFSGGTEIGVYIRSRVAPPAPSVHIDVYDESGAFLGGADLVTDRATQEVAITDILDAVGAAGTPFGVLLIDFADETDGGHVTATYAAEGRYSVGMRGGCLLE